MVATSADRMALNIVLDLYLGSREASPRYRESLLRTVRKAEAAGIRSLDDLTPEVVNRFLSGLSTAATTRQNVRRELLTLWRWAFEEGMIETPPLRVMRIKSSQRPPSAWSLPELSRMLDCAETDLTVVHQKKEMRVCDYMPCWVAVAYDTGLRFGDMLPLCGNNIRNGFVVVTAAKTGKAATRPLSNYALAKALALLERSPDKTLFSWFLTRRRAFIAMRAFLDRHGFEGSGKFLRRSCATYVESVAPGHATRYLQHSAAHLAQRHYIDESLLSLPSGPPPIKPCMSGQS